MKSVEISAKTVEEAIALAASELEVSLREVEVEVLSRGKAGFLGFGAEPAKVRVRLRPRPPEEGVDVPSLAQEALGKLMGAMGITAMVHLKAGTGPPSLDIRGEDLGILIGRRGETLSALQYVVNLVVSRHLKARAGIVIDVEGYRQRRQEALQGLALRLAERVKATGRMMALEPMPPDERRIVHLTLRDDPEVVTESVGEGEARKVVISPRKGRPGG